MYGKEVIESCRRITYYGGPNPPQLGVAMATVKDGNDTEEFYNAIRGRPYVDPFEFIFEGLDTLPDFEE
jgi:hypothetical protein